MSYTLPYHSGVAVPVFSLRSNDSCGIGEFPDLKKLADWCVATGLKMIQILPINDTTTDGSWSDSYPYKSISTKELHPIYLNVEKVGLLKDENDRKRFEELKKELNAKEFVDYPEVFKAKMDYLKKVYAQKRGKKPDFYEFLQQHCDKQLSEAVDYLHSNGIMLKGDLPIGVNRESDDVKQNPHLFNLDMETGELGLPHLQLGSDGKRRFPVVERARRMVQKIFRRLAHRPYLRLLPHLGDPERQPRRKLRPLFAREPENVGDRRTETVV